MTETAFILKEEIKASEWYNSGHGKEIKIPLILLHIYRILEIRSASETIYRTQLTF